MKTSNIKLNTMPTYNQHNHYHQLSITNFVGRKETKTKQKGELQHLDFQRRAICVLLNYNLPNNVVMCA